MRKQMTVVVLLMMLIACPAAFAGEVALDTDVVEAPVAVPEAPEALVEPVIAPETPALVEADASSEMTPEVPEATEVPAEAPLAVEETPAVIPVEPPTTDSAAVDTALKIVSAARDGQWTLFAGMLLMLLVYVFNRMGMGAKIGTKAVPWVTVGLGVLSSVGFGIANGEVWYTGIIYGLFMSASAIALWELVIKHLTALKVDGRPRD
jgi:hypothetical protein